MAISNNQKRKLTCQFCPKQKTGCKCQKFWKQIYREHRDEILELYHSSTPPQPQVAQKDSTLNKF